jgi:hypothetical protein
MEVMAGLALLAIVLVVLLQIEARSRRQAARAERRAHAVQIADEMLGQWWQLPQGLPRVSGSVVPADPSLMWRTTTIDDPAVHELFGQVVRFQLFDSLSAEPLVSTDVVVPINLTRAKQTR